MKWLLTCLIAISLCCTAKGEEYRHEGAENLFLSYDGSTLLSENIAPADNSDLLRGWDLTNRQPLNLEAINQEKLLKVVTFSGAGDEILVRLNDKDGNVRNYQIWQRKNSQFVLSATIPPADNADFHEEFLTAAFHKRTLILLRGGAIETYDLTGKSLRRVPFKTRMGWHSHPILSRDVDWILAFVDGRRSILDAKTGQVHHVLAPEAKKDVPADAEYFNHRFSSNGCFVAGGLSYLKFSNQGYVDEYFEEHFIWNVQDGKMVWGAPGGIFFGDNQLWDGLDVWDIKTHKKVKRLASPWGEPGKRDLMGYRISDDGKVWVMLDENGNIGIGRN